jgi:hypothetical protein
MKPFQSAGRSRLAGPNAVKAASARCRLIPLVVVLFIFGSFAWGCGGGGGGGSTVGPSAPFNTTQGEGNLISHRLVVTYPTATTDAGPGLDAIYVAGICGGLTTSECAANKASLNTPPFGNFNLDLDPIGNNPLGIKRIDAAKIDYTAIGVDQSAVKVSGGIVIPELAPASLKGLILYFHETTAQRIAVPSGFSTIADPTTPNADGILLAAVWASQGYVVVMPDYLGLGDDLGHVHPYILYPAQDAQSGLAMVKAARSLLASSYGINARLPMFITGYSEGGAYALQAEHLMQDNALYASVLNVSLKKAAPLSGAYDPSGTMLPAFLDDITATHNNWLSENPQESGLSKPYIDGYLATSFASYSGVAATDILAGSFYNCANPSSCGGGANLTALYFASALSNGDSADADDVIALIAYNQAITTGYSYGSNAVIPFLTPAYAKALENKDPSNPLYKQAVAAQTYQFTPAIPITLISLKDDSVVSPKNSDTAFTYFEQQNPAGPYKEDLVDNAAFQAPGVTAVGPIDHVTELPFLSVLILNEFNTTR